MTFDLANFGFGNLAQAAPALHTYKTTDTAATINTAGYFNDLAEQLRVGDGIYVFADTGGTPQAYLFWVNANNGTVVDVPDGTALGTTDSD